MTATRSTRVDAYGALTEPATLTIQRLLPGPIDRVWAFLTQGELRRRWLAAGEMKLQLGTAFELVWRNDELTDPPGERPDSFPAEHRMESRITEIDAPRRLAFTWNGTGDVSFDLAPLGEQVLLTVTHRRLPDRATTLNVSGGWHMHLDVLAAVMSGARPSPFWDGWLRLKEEYAVRLGSEVAP